MAMEFDPGSLSEAERAPLARMNTGKVMDFTDAGKVKPTIRAAFLPDLALRPTPPVCGIRLRKARIAGALDLTYTQLRALVLEDCEIADPIDLSHARIDALSIERSRFSHVLARAAVIDGPFDLSDAGPVDAAAWIDANKAKISGGITGLRARLKMPAPRPQTEVKLWDRVYALRLSEAEIGGDVWLADRFVADGGICFDDAHLRGSLSLAQAAVITPSEGDAFHPGDALHAYALRCDGMAGMNFGFRSEGRTFIPFSRFGSRLHIDGTLRRARAEYDFKGRFLNTGAALMVDDCHIGANVVFTADTSVDGAISFNRSKIGGNLSFAGSDFSGLSKVRVAIRNRSVDGQMPALSIEQAAIAGDILFGHRFSAEGRVSLARSRLGGDLDFVGATFENRTEDETGTALDARPIRVTGEARPAPWMAYLRQQSAAGWILPARELGRNQGPMKAIFHRICHPRF
jgi:hypothetical protein